MYLNATTPQHPNAILTLEIPYILTVDQAALAGDRRIKLKSNVAIALPANTVVNFGSVSVALPMMTPLSKVGAMVMCGPLSADLAAGTRSDMPMPNNQRPRNVLTHQIKAWLADSGRRGSFNQEPLEAGQTILKGRALEPIPVQFKPCQYAKVEWMNGDADPGVLKFFVSARSFLRVEQQLGQRILGVFSAEVPV